MSATENENHVTEDGMHKDGGVGLTRRRFLQLSAGAALATASSVGGLSLLSGCRSEVGDAFFRGERTVTDHAGREMIIPTVDTLERVYFTSALAQIFVFTLDPSKQAGTGIQYTAEELAYLPEGTNDLVYMGSLSGGGEIDREMLMFQDVQLIFSVSGIALTEANISEADKMQNQTGIPVLCVDGSFENISNAYRFMGEVLGQEQRAEEIAVYLEDVYQRVTDAVADVEDQQRVSLYYAEGPVGLQTEPNISQHALTFEVAKAHNVAASVDLTEGLGMTNVSLEQVLSWNPDVIIAWDSVVRGGGDEIIRSSPDWAPLKAVRDGRVYTMPNAPFAWCDRPPGVNRFLGIQWIANLLYPEKYDVDMVEVVKDFYSRLYWRDITDQQAKELLGNSYPVKKS